MILVSEENLKDLEKKYKDRRTCRDALLAQIAIKNDGVIADLLLEKAIDNVKAYRKQEDIITQGESETDMVLILHGAVDVIVDGFPVARRSATHHVGEMALLQLGEARSATVKAASELVVTTRIERADFADAAAQHSDLWKNLACELASRLRQRSKFIVPPNEKCTVFIGSSSEGLKVAKKVDELLKEGLGDDVKTLLWSKDVFKAGNSTASELVSAAQKVDFAILVLTDDDVVISRKKKKRAPRDNVILELGLMIGAVGLTRALYLVPKSGPKLPTDLDGMTHIRYANHRQERQRTESLTEACRQVIERIKEQGIRRAFS